MARTSRLSTLLFLGAVAYLCAWPVDIEPAAWEAPGILPATGALAANDDLADCNVFARMPGNGPDSLAIDAIGYVYTGLGNGQILRISPDGSSSSTLATFDGRATGIAFDRTGNIIVADERGGAVYTLQDDGSLVPLLRDIDGEPLMFVNDVAVGNDGTIYITESSTRFTLEQLRFEILEHRPNGRILEYSPSTRRARVLRDGLYFPNGIVVSPDQNSIVFAETTAYRVSRLWIQGDAAGSVETLLNELPGFPGDVSVAESGRFWLSLVAPRSRFVDDLSRWPGVRMAMARLPAWLLPNATAFPYLVAFSADGTIERSLQASSRPDLPSFSSVIESGGSLFLGTPGIGAPIDADVVYRLRLDAPESAATPQ